MSEINSIANGTFTIGSTSAINFQAGPGITVTEPSAGTVRIRNDETLLWSGNLNETTYTAVQNLSESITNFERVRFNWKIDGCCGSVECPANSGLLCVPYSWKLAAAYIDVRLNISANKNKWKFNDSIKWQISTASYSISNFSHNWSYSMIPIREIVGINRISGGNA